MGTRFRSIVLAVGLGLFCPFSEVAYATGDELSPVVNVETTITAVSAAELEIGDNRVSKTVTWGPKILYPTSLEQRKRNLITELCIEVGADVIVDPQFVYSKRILGGGKLTLYGYPARYKNFRSMSEQEIDSFIVSPQYQTGKVVFINK